MKNSLIKVLEAVAISTPVRLNVCVVKGITPVQSIERGINISGSF